MHDPIIIDGDVDFSIQALTEGWSGDGSQRNPCIIENYSIKATGLPAVLISNTNSHVILRNLELSGATLARSTGLSLRNVSNAQLQNNTVNANFHGISLWNSRNIVLHNNTANDNIDRGFSVGTNSRNNTLSNNIALNNNEGFYLTDNARNNIIINNLASNGRNGFVIRVNSESNFLENNTASNNTFTGFNIFSSDNNMLLNNTASHNSRGFYLWSDLVHLSASENNLLIHNVVCNNLGYGVALDSESRNNILNNNNFINNNAGNIQAEDDGFNNTFITNYWNDWNGSSFYTIDGKVKNQDFSPQAEFQLHACSNNVQPFDLLLVIQLLFEMAISPEITVIVFLGLIIIVGIGIWMIQFSFKRRKKWTKKQQQPKWPIDGILQSIEQLIQDLGEDQDKKK